MHLFTFSFWPVCSFSYLRATVNHLLERILNLISILSAILLGGFT